MHKRLLITAALASAILLPVGQMAWAQKDPVPIPLGKSLRSGASTVVDYDVLMHAGTLPAYHEPDWVTDLVKQGKLPPLNERLPEQPLIVDMSHSTPDGVGVYGGVLRHVSGARPQGWNWMAHNILAWGGVEQIIDLCLVRIGPVWMLSSKKSEPLPQLATSWDWSPDGHQLTMHLLKGAKWSDGVPFTSDDVMFMWDDNISDPNVPAWARPAAFGEGTKLEKVDDYTIRWTFKDAFPIATLFQMGYQKLCPGPAHVLKPLHPKYNKNATYESYINALKPEKVPWVTMGPWTVTEYKPDQIMVMRRNPYFSEVDEKGNQLPYLDEVQYKLSTWEDRTIQTVAGSADYTNMEDPSIYLESLKRAQDANFPNQILWGPRSLDWSIYFNLSEVCGVNDDREKARRELFRTFDFRRAVTQLVDRQALAQSLARGPFIAPHAGGLHLETDFADPSMVVYYPYDLDGAKKLLAKLGFKPGPDGLLVWPDGSPLAGQKLDIPLLHTSLYTTDRNLAQSLVTMFREAGINLILQPNNTEMEDVFDSCQWDLALRRNDREFQAPLTELERLAPLSWSTPRWHHGTAQQPQHLLDFEKDLIAILDKIRTEPDSAKRKELLQEYDKIFTKNVYTAGLIQIPAAIIINKRFRNVPPGTPTLAYDWGEDGLLRERLWVRAADQGKVPELAPRTLPGID